MVPHSAKLHNFTDEQQSQAKVVFRDLGPVPRICIDYVGYERLLYAYQRQCQYAIAILTKDSLRHLALRGGNLDLNAESEMIFLIRRDEVDDLEVAHIEPISKDIEMQLVATINALQEFKRIGLYAALSSVTATRKVAGLVYESLGHTRLQEGITLFMKPMIKLPLTRELKLHWFHHWIPQGEDSMYMDNARISVTFPANTPIVYEGKLTSLERNRLYVPKKSNQVAFDSFYQHNKMLYFFQFTMAASHDIRSGMEDSLSEAGLLDIFPPKANWRFVFITPPDCSVTAKGNSVVNEFLKGVTLYSAHLEVVRRMGPIASWLVWASDYIDGHSTGLVFI